MAVSRFDVFLVNLDPTVGSEIRKSRPCVVVSPDEMNRHVRTVVVAPLTTSSRPYPSRVPVRFAGKDGQVVIDQLRTVDKARLAARLGALDAHERPRCSTCSGSSSRREGGAGGDYDGLVRSPISNGFTRGHSAGPSPGWPPSTSPHVARHCQLRRPPVRATAPPDRATLPGWMSSPHA